MFPPFRKYTAAFLAACFLTMPLAAPVEASWAVSAPPYSKAR